MCETLSYSSSDNKWILTEGGDITTKEIYLKVTIVGFLGGIIYV